MVSCENHGLWTIKTPCLIYNSAFDIHDLGKLTEPLQFYKIKF